MARFRHISTKMVLVLDAGQADGKKVTKRVTVSGIREDASTDALWELAQAMGKLLEYPVAEVRLYKVEAVEREEADGAADKNGGVNKEADAGMGADAAWVNDGTAAVKGLQYDERMARAGGGVGESGLLSRSCNDGYLKEPRQFAFSPGNNRALRATSRMAIGSAAIQHRTPPGYTRPPPACGQGAGQKPDSFSSRSTLTAGRGTAVAFSRHGRAEELPAFIPRITWVSRNASKKR